MTAAPIAPVQTRLDLGEVTPALARPLDVREVIAAVHKRHDTVRLRADDPVLVLLTIYEETQKHHAAQLAAHLQMLMNEMSAATEQQKAASREIAQRLINEGSAYMVKRVKEAGDELPDTVARAVLAAITPALAVQTRAVTDAKSARLTAITAAVCAAAAALVAIVAAVAF